MVSIFLVAERHHRRLHWLTTEQGAVGLAREVGGRVERVDLRERMSTRLLALVLNQGKGFPDAVDADWLRVREIARFPGRLAPGPPRHERPIRELVRPPARFTTGASAVSALYLVDSGSGDDRWHGTESGARAAVRESSRRFEVFSFFEPATVQTLVDILNLGAGFPTQVVGRMVARQQMGVPGNLDENPTPAPNEPPRPPPTSREPASSAAMEPTSLKPAKPTITEPAELASTQPVEPTSTEPVEPTSTEPVPPPAPITPTPPSVASPGEPIDIESEVARQTELDSRVERQEQAHSKRKKLALLVGALVVMMGLGWAGWRLADNFGPGPSAAEHVAAANEHSDDGDIRAAIVELKNALQKNPQMVPARQLLAELYVDVGQGAAALKELDLARGLGVPTGELVVLRLRAMLLERQFAPVLEVLDDQVLADDALTALLLRGGAELGLKNHEAARRAFNEVEEIDAGNLDGQLGLAKVAFAAKRFETARILAVGAGDNREALLLRGKVELVTGNFDDAQPLFELVLSVSELDFDAHLGLIRAHLGNGDAAAADRQVRDAESIWPGHPLLLHSSALGALLRADLEEARSKLRAVLGVIPGHILSHLTLAAVYFQSETFELAENELVKLLAIDPNHVVGRKLLGATLLRLNRPDAAIETLQAVLPDDRDVESLVLLGHSYLELDNFDEGAKLLEQAAAMSPQATVISTQPTMMELVGGVISEAANELSQIVSLKPGYKQVGVLPMLSHLQQKDYDKALALARNYHDIHPDSALSQGLLGKVFEEMGNFDKAKSHYLSALDLNPDYVSPMLSLARITRDQGDKQEIEKLYRALHAHSKDNPGVLDGLANLGIETRDWEVIGDLLRQGSGQNSQLLLAKVLVASARSKRLSGDAPGAIKTLSELVKTDPSLLEARFELAMAYAANDNPLMGSSHLQKLLRYHPDYQPARLALIRLHLSRGRADKARSLAEEIVKAYPDRSSSHELWGDVLMGIHAYQPAVSAYLRAFRLQSSGDIAIKLSGAYRSSEQVSRGYETLKDWLDDHPHDTETRAVLASIYLDDKHKKKATAEYERILEDEPEHLRALQNLTWLYAKTDEPRARELAEHAYRLFPDDPYVMDAYVWRLLQKGSLEQALRLIERVRLLIPEDPGAGYRYALVLAQRGDKRQARTELRQILAASEEFDEREQAQALFEELAGGN